MEVNMLFYKKYKNNQIILIIKINNITKRGRKISIIKINQ